MFLGLVPNLGHLLSTCIHALESTTCQTRPSLILFSRCHTKSLDMADK
jgi:hypothetical protein